MVRTALGLMLAALTGGAAETLVERFAATPADSVWTLHQEGAGRSGVDGGVLVLDLSAAVPGKHAWAECVPWLKLPASLEWRQATQRDSPHFYHAGLYLQDPAGGCVTFGLSGQPLGQRVQAGGKPGGRTHPAGEWCGFRLEVAADRAAVLTVTGGQGLDAERFEVRLTGLQGRLLRAGFFHNQPRNQGPDAYAQDRGSSAVADVRIEAAAFYRGDPAAYRDSDLRGTNPREPITFNRAMRWATLPAVAGGGALAYDAAPQLALTGSDQVTDWQSNRGCSLTSVDATRSRFRRPNDLDGADSTGIPMLQ